MKRNQILAALLAVILTMGLAACGVPDDPVERPAEDIAADEAAAAAAEAAENEPETVEEPIAEEPVEEPAPEPVHEHEFVLVSAEELTCTTNAVEHYECSCGKTDFSITERATGHKWRIVSYTAATCSAGKHVVMRCDVCGEEKEIIGEQTIAHRMEATVVEPTCTEEGYTGSVCLNCGYVAEKSDIVPATGHQMKKVTVKPTCTEEGYTAEVCKVCGYAENKTNPVEATGHNMKDKVIAPTCTAVGYTEHKCKTCGYIEKTDEVPMIDHNLKSTVIAPTCTTDGYTTSKCTACGYENGKTDIVPALGHTMASRTVEATCTTQGYDESYCTECGYSAGKTNIVPALGHNYVDKVTEPTKTAGGYTEHTCSRCGDYVKDTLTDKLPDPIDIDELMAAGNAKIRAMGCKVDTSLTPNNSGYQMTSLYSYSMYGDRGTYVKSRVISKAASDLNLLFESFGEEDMKQYGRYRCYVEETSDGTGIEVYILYR